MSLPNTKQLAVLKDFKIREVIWLEKFSNLCALVFTWMRASGLMGVFIFIFVCCLYPVSFSN